MRLKKLKYIYFALICMCVTPLITHAECDYTRQAELSRLASNVQLTYTYSQENGFQIIMTNLTNDLYATDIYEQVIPGGQEHTFNYASGNYSFKIYSNDANCYGEELLTKSITLPTLNNYVMYDECQQYPNFKYCQLWGNISVDPEQFRSEFNQYKQNVEKNKINNDIEKVSTLDIILEVLNNNIFMFILLGSIVLITVIALKIKGRH